MNKRLVLIVLGFAAVFLCLASFMFFINSATKEQFTTAEPAAELTAEPTMEPTTEPTLTSTSTPEPTSEPTSQPTAEPTPTTQPKPMNCLDVDYYLASHLQSQGGRFTGRGYTRFEIESRYPQCAVWVKVWEPAPVPVVEAEIFGYMIEGEWVFSNLIEPRSNFNDHTFVAYSATVSAGKARFVFQDLRKQQEEIVVFDGNGIAIYYVPINIEYSQYLLDDCGWPTPKAMTLHFLDEFPEAEGEIYTDFWNHPQGDCVFGFAQIFIRNREGDTSVTYLINKEGKISGPMAERQNNLLWHFVSIEGNQLTLKTLDDSDQIVVTIP